MQQQKMDDKKNMETETETEERTKRERQRREAHLEARSGSREWGSIRGAKTRVAWVRIPPASIKCHGVNSSREAHLEARSGSRGRGGGERGGDAR